LGVLTTVYDLSAHQLADALELLLDHRGLVVQDADVVANALQLFPKRPALGYSDCLMVEIARKQRHLPLGTFDRELARVEDVQRL
jgi:predicted nucleic-acid-binding protein